MHISPMTKRTFERYLRENIAAKMLCGIYNTTNIENVELNDVKYGLFSISDLLIKVEKGNTKSIDRKLENKYDLNGLPLIIAKKDLPLEELIMTSFPYVYGHENI